MHYSTWVRRSLLIGPLVFGASCNQTIKQATAAGSTSPHAKAHFSILQINDSYKIEGLENGHVGGFARLRTLRRQLEAGGNPLLMLHGGDFLFPSVMSKYLKADAMISVLNLMDGNATAYDDNMIVVFGNHEFDDPDPGLLLRRIVQSDFAWLSSNTRFSFSESSEAEPFSKRLPNVHDVLLKEIEGVKVGLFGITLDSQKRPYISFDYAIEARRAAINIAIADLKAQGADVIIALTHQDFDQDQWLAGEFPEVNLIVGGHEHFYIGKQIGNTWITKADADIKSALVHDIRVMPDGSVDISHRKIDLDGKIDKDPQVDAEIGKQLARLTDSLKKNGMNLNQVVGYTQYLLEGVEQAVRGRETALGNFLTDVMREQMNTDIAFTNGGGIRINDNIPPGPVTVYDMEGLFYYDNNLVSFELTGAQLLAVLKNSVSKSHLGDGRFLQVSGIRFRYRATAANGAYTYAVDPSDVEIKLRGASVYVPLDMNKTYRAASTDFIWEKGDSDGYAIFSIRAVKSRPPRIDNGKAISFRKTVEAAIGKLPNKTIINKVEGRIVRQEL